MADAYNQTSVPDNQENEHCGSGGDTDSDIWEDDPDMGKPDTDTTALEAKNGKDLLGILWCRFNSCRGKYQEMRVRQYQNFESVPLPKQDVKGVQASGKRKYIL